jgi:hypothetical protein
LDCRKKLVWRQAKARKKRKAGNTNLLSSIQESRSDEENVLTGLSLGIRLGVLGSIAAENVGGLKSKTRKSENRSRTSSVRILHTQIFQRRIGRKNACMELMRIMMAKNIFALKAWWPGIELRRENRCSVTEQPGLAA